MIFNNGITVISPDKPSGLKFSEERINNFASQVKTCCAKELLDRWEKLVKEAKDPETLVDAYYVLNKAVDPRDDNVLVSPAYLNFKKKVCFNKQEEENFRMYRQAWREFKFFERLSPRGTIQFISRRYEERLRTSIHCEDKFLDLKEGNTGEIITNQYIVGVMKEDVNDLAKWVKLSEKNKIDRVIGNPTKDHEFYTYQDCFMDNDSITKNNDLFFKAMKHLSDPRETIKEENICR